MRKLHPSLLRNSLFFSSRVFVREQWILLMRDVREMVGLEIYSVLYFEAAEKSVKYFGKGIAHECMPRASLTLFLSHCFMECWDTCGLMWCSAVMQKKLKQCLLIVIFLKCEF